MHMSRKQMHNAWWSTMHYALAFCSYAQLASYVMTSGSYKSLKQVVFHNVKVIEGLLHFIRTP